MDDAPKPDRRTRLVATIGPASIDRVGELVAAGLDVARVNLSHGSEAEHEAAVAAVRRAAEATGRHIAVLVDLPGPKIRLGDLESEAIVLSSGERVALVAGGAIGSAMQLPLRETSVLPALRSGDRVLLADGAAELRVVSDADGGRVEAEVVRGGPIRSRAGVSVPAERVAADELARADDALLPRVARLAPDYVGQSFIRSAAEVERLRPGLPADVGIVAKIETRPAVDDIEAIVRASDAVMVARGDLGVELPFEEVPLVQKDLIRAALAAGRPSIVATQMLESMVEAPRPTRAEASDVANAILDGADAVMLSAETAIGAYPVLALRAAGRIATTTDRRPLADRVDRDRTATFEGDPDARATALAAMTLAREDPSLGFLACFTRSGRTARLLAALRPAVPIVALTSSRPVARSLALVRGVRAVHVAIPPGADVGATVADAVEHELATGGVAAAALVTSSVDDGPNALAIVRRRSR